ncbi:MAG: FHA domain-containing protein [Phototrophicales bacterium]|nr:FHA domain-containing protein [Phototrophicales bacterium]
MTPNDCEHLVIWVDIEGVQTDFEMWVRPKVLIKQVITTLVQEHNLPTDKYELALKLLDGGAQPLRSDRTLGQEEVADQAKLVFYRRKGGTDIKFEERKYFSQSQSVAKIKMSQQKIITLEWQPAVIGRHDDNPANNDLLAVDVSALPNSQKVSRRHACVTYRDGNYYLHHLSQKSRTYLNDQLLTLEQSYRLKGGDKIRLGDAIILEFMVRDA